MVKNEEHSNPSSCFNRAKDDEMVFVLLARDAAAPAAVEAWVAKRVQIGKNSLEDPEIVDALACATEMRRQRVSGELR